MSTIFDNLEPQDQELEKMFDKQLNHRDLKIFDRYISYGDNKDKSEAAYFYYLLGRKDDDGSWHKWVKVVKLCKVYNVPKELREKKALMVSQDELLSAIWREKLNFITIYCNMPDNTGTNPKGFYYCYGVQVMEPIYNETEYYSKYNTEEEKIVLTSKYLSKKADEAYGGLIRLLRGNFRQAQFLPLTMKEAEAIRKTIENGTELQVIRGIPKTHISAASGVTTSMTGITTTPDGIEQNEEFIRAMLHDTYANIVMAFPIPHSELLQWSSNVARELSMYKSQYSGMVSHNAGISIPMVFAGNLSATLGNTSGVTDTSGETLGVTNGTSDNYSHNVGTNQGVSHNLGYSQGQSTGLADSISQAHTDSSSQGISNSQSLTDSHGISHSISDGVTDGVTDTHGVSKSHTVGSSDTYTEGKSVSNSVSRSVGQSYSVGQTTGETTGVTNTTGHTIGHTTGTTEGTTTSHGVSSGTSSGTSSSTSTGTSASLSHSLGSTHGITNGTTETNTTGSTHTDSTSNGITSTRTAGETASDSTNNGTTNTTTGGGGVNAGIISVQGSASEGATKGIGSSIGTTVSESAGNTFSQSASDSTSLSHSLGNSHSISDSTSDTNAYSKGVSNSTSAGISHGVSNSISDGISNSLSKSNSDSVSDSTSLSNSHSLSNSLSKTHGTSESVSVGKTVGESYSHSRGTSVSDGISETVSKGISHAKSHSVSDGTSESQSTGTSIGKTDTRAQGVSAGVGKTANQGLSQSLSDGQGVSKGVSSGDSRGQGVSIGKSQALSNSQGLSNARSNALGVGQGLNFSFGPTIGVSKSRQVFDEEKGNLIKLLEAQNNRLNLAVRMGAFYVDAYTVCYSPVVKRGIGLSAVSSWGGDTEMSTIQVVDPDVFTSNHLMKHASVFEPCTMKESIDGIAEGYLWSTIMLSSELAAFTHLPRVESGGPSTVATNIPPFSVFANKQGEIYFGKQINYEDGEPNYDYSFAKSEFMHTLICGASGCGKTTSAVRIAREVIEKYEDMKIFVLDWKNSWRVLKRFAPNGVDDFEFYGLDYSSIRPIHMNIYVPPKYVGFKQWIDKVNESLCLGFGFGTKMLSVLDKAVRVSMLLHGIMKVNAQGAVIELSREEVGDNIYKVTLSEVYKIIQSMKRGTVPTFDDFILNFSNLEKGAQELIFENFSKQGMGMQDAYDSILSKLENFYSGQLKELYCCQDPEKCIRIEELIDGKRIVVLEGGDLDNSSKKFIIELISNGVFLYSKLKKNREKIVEKRFFILEEAHRIIDNPKNGNASPLGVTEDIFQIIFNEGREFGLYAMPIVQAPSELPAAIVTNCSILVVHRLGNKEDIDLMTLDLCRNGRLDNRDIPIWLAKQPIGQAIVRVNNTVAHQDSEPALIQVARCATEPPDNEELVLDMNLPIPQYMIDLVEKDEYFDREGLEDFINHKTDGDEYKKHII